MNKIIKPFVTGLYIGLIPIAPGTFGSLLAFPLCIALINLSAIFKLKIIIPSLDRIHQELLAIAILLLVACIILFIAGTYLSDLYIKATSREDPKEVVIDEIVGQMLTIILTSFTTIFAHNSHLADKLSPTMIDFIFLFFLPFGFFRLFDIFKPWPINWIDNKVKGGIGVMLDDILAAIFASVMCYAVTFMLIGNYTNAS